jgi:hypothetical protein
MPLPIPKDDEAKDDFIHRCMKAEVMLEEYPDEKQRAAVCNNQWGKSHSFSDKNIKDGMSQDDKEVKMMDWIPVFKTGFHSRSESDRNWSIEDLDAMVASTRAVGEDIPFVIGHPKKELLSWGKAEPVLKRVGDFLYAKPKEISKAFKDIVKEGLNKISIKVALPDLRVKHIGFFGPEETAVDLPGAAFMAGEESFALVFSAPEIEAATANNNTEDPAAGGNKQTPAPQPKPKGSGTPQSGRGGVTMGVKDTLAKIFPKAADKIQDIPDEDLATETPMFSEAEVKRQVAEAAKEALEKGKTEGKKEGEAEFAEQRKELKKTELNTYVDGLIAGDGKKGRALSGAKKAGLVEFMLRLDEEETIVFAEGSDDISMLAQMKAILETLPADITFTEVAGKEKDVGGGNAGEKLSKLAQEKQTKIQEGGKEISFREALDAVQVENPELAQEYLAELQGSA